MPNELTSLWTPEQIILTVVILIGAVALALARPTRRDDREPSTPGEPDARPPSPGQGRSSPPRPSGRPGKIVLALVLLATAAYLVERGGDPIGIRMDSWSDANVVVSGRNYARLGLLANYGVPQHQTVTDRNPSDPFFLYTNYPMASNWINALWRIAGVASLRSQRLLPAACALLSVIVWFGLFRRFASPAVAVVAAITLATSWGFLSCADNLYFHAYALLLCALVVYCFVQALAPDTLHRVPWLLLTGLLLFVMAYFTWEYDLWIVIFIAAYALLFKCPIRRPYLLLLMLPLLLATGLQAAQRRAAFAGAGIAYVGDDTKSVGLLDNLYRRTIGFDVAEDTAPGLTLRGYPAFEILRFYKFYGVPFLGAAALLVAVLCYGRRPPWKISLWTTEERFLVALAVASPAWWLVMMQHSSVHPHVLRHALIACSLLMAVVWVRCWKIARSSTADPSPQVLAGVLMLALLYPHVEGTVANLRLHCTDNYYDSRQRSDMGNDVSRQFTRLKQFVPPGAVILTNGLLTPMRVFSERPVYNGVFYPYPPNDPANARFFIETRFNHLRDLYQDQLPSLYYVYDTGEISPEKLTAAEPLLRLLVAGNRYNAPNASRECADILREAIPLGRSDKSFCPIVSAHDRYVVFHMDPIVPILHRMFDRLGYPTLRQFGPAR